MKNSTFINDLISILEVHHITNMPGIPIKKIPHEAVQHLQLINNVFEKGGILRYMPIEHMFNADYANMPDGVIYNKESCNIITSIQLKFRKSDFLSEVRQLELFKKYSGRCDVIMYTTASGNDLPIMNIFSNFIKHLEFEEQLKDKISKGKFDVIEDYMKEAKNYEKVLKISQNAARKALE